MLRQKTKQNLKNPLLSIILMSREAERERTNLDMKHKTVFNNCILLNTVNLIFNNYFSRECHLMFKFNSHVDLI